MKLTFRILALLFFLSTIFIAVFGMILGIFDDPIFNPITCFILLGLGWLCYFIGFAIKDKPKKITKEEIFNNNYKNQIYGRVRKENKDLPNYKKNER